MKGDNGPDTTAVTLAFSLSAIAPLEDPKEVFEDAQNWSQSIGVIDADTEQIEQIVNECDLRQDFEMQEHHKWFVLEEICETTSTLRHVYFGASDKDMRVSTFFCWEYVRVKDAAENAGWKISETRSDPGIVARILTLVQDLTE